MRDLCQRATARRVRADAGSFSFVGGGGLSQLDDGAAAAGGAGHERVVLLVTNAAGVPAVRQLWANPASKLWSGDVPRSFAPSGPQGGTGRGG